MISYGVCMYVCIYIYIHTRSRLGLKAAIYGAVSAASLMADSLRARWSRQKGT